jgi:hypothetical protein
VNSGIRTILYLKGLNTLSGNIQSSSRGFFDDFEFCNIVPSGRDPFKDIIPIPYSKQVLVGYEIIIHGLQNILKDIVENRIICIQRNLNGLIPKQRYDLSNISSEEVSSMKKIVDDFYAKNPPREIAISYNYNLNINKEEIAWYLNLREFLDECKKRKEIQDKYGNE